MNINAYDLDSLRRLVRQLQAENKNLRELLAEKQAEYERYRQHRREMLDYETAKQNVDRILGLEQPDKMRQSEKETER